MHADGWLLAPGSLFHVTARPSTLLRVNFAAAQDPRPWRALRLARDALQDHSQSAIRDHLPVTRGAVTKRRNAYHRVANASEPLP
jgi:hypothetical protein